MNARSVFVIAKRDFLQRAKSKLFIGMTLVIASLILVVGPRLAGEITEPDPIEVGVVEPVSDALVDALDRRADFIGFDYVIVEFVDLAAGETGLTDGDANVLIDGDEVVWEQDPGPITNAIVSGALQDLARSVAIEESGIDDATIESILAPPAPNSRSLEEPDPESGLRSAAAYVGTMLLFISIVLFGQFVLLGVLEEKSNRVAEVVLSRVRPVELLAGKTLGIGLLGLIQLLVFGAAILLLISTIEIEDFPDLSALGFQIVGGVVFWYILGYLFYSVLYAAAGSLVSRQEDVQGVSWIPMIGLLPSYFLALFATFSPDHIFVRVGSLIPGVAPMVMPVRAAAGDVPLWEQIVAALLTLVGTFFVLRFAARVYRGGILQSGRTKLREAWRGAEA